MMRFIFITNSPDLAAFAEANGVDRIMVDLELNGKVDRQGHLSTVISRHAMSDIPLIRTSISHAELLVRINPVHAGTQQEVEQAIAHGADAIMLPMFRTASEVQVFCAAVGGRCKVVLLLETAAATANLAEILTVQGIDEIHIGLNDLHLDLGLSFMFQPIAGGFVDHIATMIRAAGLPLGIGGLARAGEGLLPADMLVAEHVRLGSTGAILSRTFHRNAATVKEIEAEMNFGAEVAKLQEAFIIYGRSSEQELLAVHQDVANRVAEIVRAKTLTK